MRLTEKEQAMLNGEMGPGFARAMRVLVGIGKAFGAERMVPISRGHISLSNQEGDLWFVSKLLEEQAHCMVPPTVNPAYDYEYIEFQISYFYISTFRVVDFLIYKIEQYLLYYITQKPSGVQIGRLFCMDRREGGGEIITEIHPVKLRNFHEKEVGE